MVSGVCLSNGWSVVTSAPSNSQLAGVLAGFVFTGVIILYASPGPRAARTIALLCAAFVVLGFDSYLFSSISGNDADPLCGRVWSEAMAASGMLAVGGVALVGAIGWLLAVRDGEAAIQAPAAVVRPRGPVNLQRMSWLMVWELRLQ
jgi:hypothetical protein